MDDRHCVAKHDLIYPEVRASSLPDPTTDSLQLQEEELEAIQKIVVHSETALKKVSDYLAAQDAGGEKKVILKITNSITITINYR